MQQRCSGETAQIPYVCFRFVCRHMPDGVRPGGASAVSQAWRSSMAASRSSRQRQDSARWQWRARAGQQGVAAVGKMPRRRSAVPGAGVVARSALLAIPLYLTATSAASGAGKHQGSSGQSRSNAQRPNLQVVLEAEAAAEAGQRHNGGTAPARLAIPL